MAADEARNFLFLNVRGSWPGFSFDSLQLQADGSLSLSPVARLKDGAPADFADLPVPFAPGGVAIDRDGNLYWSDPDRNRILCRRACDQSVAALRCLDSAAAEGGPLRAPRGLVVPPTRQALFIVDSGNDRVVAVDLATHQLLEIWPASAARHAVEGDAPGAFDTPWTAASDAEGSVYIVDYGNRTVQKLRVTGLWDDRFFENVRASGLLVAPSAVTVTSYDAAVRVLIADPGASSIFFFDGYGQPERDAAGAPVVIALDATTMPMGMAATGANLFLGDNSRARILQFQLTSGHGFGSFVEVQGYQGPVSSLALADSETLVVYPGGGVAPATIVVAGGFRSLGAAWSQRIDLGYPVKWHELVAELQPLAVGAHLDVYAYASANPGDTPLVVEDPALRTFFADPRWQRQVRSSAVDVTGVYIGNASSPTAAPKLRYLWVGVEFRSDGRKTAVLDNLRVEFNQSGYLALLPAIYAADSPGEFLPRLLALFQGFFERVDYEIAALPLLFDPALAPRAFLDWLAGWLGVQLDESWTDEKRRQAIAEAFAWFGLRGTRRGLEHSIQFATGIRAIVEEPAVQATCWCLPDPANCCCEDCAVESANGDSDPTATEDSVLGWTTMLAPSQPDGAVVGTTAVLDQSKLIRENEFGSPVFSDVAYRFSVLVPRGALTCPESVGRLRSIVESEMPAHTAYHLCVVDPLMRVGYQARVGVDTIVAGPPPSMRLGEGASFGATSVLGGPLPARLGQGARIGITARID